MTTDGLLSAEEHWRAILESGFGAVDMEAAGVAEACQTAGVDWSVYRGISDRPDENIIDQAVFALSKPDWPTSTAPWDGPPTSRPRRRSRTSPAVSPRSVGAHAGSFCPAGRGRRYTRSGNLFPGKL
jgi:hypothetical protein